MINLMRVYEGPFRVMDSATSQKMIVDRNNKAISIIIAHDKVLELLVEALNMKYAFSQIMFGACLDAINNKEILKSSRTGKCSCYHCQTVMEVKEVNFEVEDTCICPKCGIDSLIPGIIPPNILEDMYSYLFSEIEHGEYITDSILDD